MNADKPLIGLVPLVDVERDSYWMMPPYFAALERAGALPVMLPLTADEADLRQLVGLCDGLVFTGGPDVDPALYGEEKLPACKLVLPQEEPCPLVLDDALANFDDSRMALALECLEELGEERQILLFTCHSRERAWQQSR